MPIGHTAAGLAAGMIGRLKLNAIKNAAQLIEQQTGKMPENLFTDNQQKTINTLWQNEVDKGNKMKDFFA